MIRRPALAAATLATLAACGSSPAGSYDEAASGRPDADAAIAGEVLTCAGDYPDSRLIFVPDGTLGGRFAGGPVDGSWEVPAPGRVEVEILADGITIRDTMRRTATGWESSNTLCG